MKLLDIIKEQYSDDAVNWIKDNVDINKTTLTDISTLKPIIPYQPTNNKPNLSIPLIVDADNFIEDGNHRYFFAKDNNIDKLPVLFIPIIPSHFRKLVINHLYNLLSKPNIEDNKTFLGYHSSKRKLNDGLYKGVILNKDNYADIIRSAYMDIISDGDEILEYDDIDAMNDVFENSGYRFTFVSKDPIMGTAFQPDKYKYGNFIYKVFGDGDEILLDDPNEIKADIVVTKKPLYFKFLNESDN